MLIPIRCFTCGALIGDKYEEFKKKVEQGEEPAKALDELGVKKYCCRRMLLSNVDIIDYMLPYYEVLALRRAEMEAERI